MLNEKSKSISAIISDTYITFITRLLPLAAILQGLERVLKRSEDFRFVYRRETIQKGTWYYLESVEIHSQVGGLQMSEKNNWKQVRIKTYYYGAELLIINHNGPVHSLRV